LLHRLPLLAFALTTGMRPSEYLALKWSDIDRQRRTASVCRTIQVTGATWASDDIKRKRSRRIVKLHNFVLKALQALREKQEGEREGNCCSAHELMFISAAGRPLKQRAVKREFRKLLAIARIRSVRLYDLRHTAATLAIAAGVSVKVISISWGMRAFRSRWGAIPMCCPPSRMRQRRRWSGCWWLESSLGAGDLDTTPDIRPDVVQESPDTSAFSLLIEFRVDDLFRAPLILTRR
jgi:hypothetical protein